MIGKAVSIIYQEDPQRIISKKENSLTIMTIKSINITLKCQGYYMRL
jgi:hypothetical protein